MAEKKTYNGAEWICSCPNLFTEGAKAGLLFSSALTAVVSQKGASWLMEQREAYNVSDIQYKIEAEERARKHAELKSQLAESQNKTKEVTAGEDLKRTLGALETERATQASKVESAQHRADRGIIEEQVEADKNVIAAESAGKKEVVKAGEKQKKEGAKQKTGHELKEQETKHQTEMFQRTATHLDVMTELSGDLSHAAAAGAVAAQGNRVVLEATKKSVKLLTKSMDKVNEAYSNLNQALSDYTVQTHGAELGAAKAVKMEEALLDIMQAESELDTNLDLDKLEISADLKASFKTDLAGKNEAISKLLEEHSSQSLEKLSELIQTDMTAQQDQINDLTDPKDIGACQDHIAKLEGLLDKVDKVTAAKEIAQEQNKNPEETPELGGPKA